jgi:hypothetical protein
VQRGFKSRAEESSRQARLDLGLNEDDPLDPWRYASHLGVEVLALLDLDLDPVHLEQLTTVDPSSWSGMTLEDEGAKFIVLNPAHARVRQRSTLMHELAHVRLRHVPARVDVSPNGHLLLSDYDLVQEEEADWLAGTLLLPRVALVRDRGRGCSVVEIAENFGVSVQLCSWRLQMTGVEAQLSRRASSTWNRTA